MKLKDKVALVTGASRGIGRGIALRLAAEGCHIAGVSRSEESAGRIKAEIEALGVTYRGYGVDVADGASVEQCVGSVTTDFGQLDILVNNAGITRDTLLMRMSDEDWKEVIDTNLTGAFFFTRAAGKHMMRSRSGRIINISSVVGLHGNAGQANYASAKAGMVGLTKSVARELASRNVLCNVICPGFIETDMTGELNEDVRAKVLDEIPLKRFGQAEDIANMVAFLSGNESTYLTGQVIAIDGGLFI